jgi:hypothetical protein
MWLHGWVDLDTLVIFEGKELSFYEEFFNYWYRETLQGKLKNDFSSYVWDLGEECQTVKEFWKRCKDSAEWHMEDLIDPKRIYDGNLRYNFIDFANVKINQEVGRFNDFCCENQYLTYFVLPECYSLAIKKIGTFRNFLFKDEFLQYCNIGYPKWILEEYRDSIVQAMYESFSQTKYADKIQTTLNERFLRVANNAVSQFVEPEVTTP